MSTGLRRATMRASLLFGILVQFAQDAHADIKEVNLAVAQSLAQSNAFNLNVGIQDFPGQLYVVLTNLTEGTRELVADRRRTVEFRQFLQTEVIDKFENVRADLRTAADDITSAGLNINIQNVVNTVIKQFNEVYKLMDEQIEFDGTYYYRGRFLNTTAKKEFYALVKQLQNVIYLHQAAVRAAQ